MKLEEALPLMKREKGIRRSDWAPRHAIWLDDYNRLPASIYPHDGDITIKSYEITQEDIWAEDWEVL